jgi:hypothetical protein
MKKICKGCKEEVNQSDIPGNKYTRKGLVYCKQCWKIDKDKIKHVFHPRQEHFIRKEEGHFEVAFP